MKKFITHLNKETQKAIQLYFDGENWNSSENLRVLNGFLPSRNYYNLVIALSCNADNKHGDNGFACNDNEKIILSYAEGDIFLTICQTDEQYLNEKMETIEFYKNN